MRSLNIEVGDKLSLCLKLTIEVALQTYGTSSSKNYL